MKPDHFTSASPAILEACARLGDQLGRLRVAHRLKQSDAAVRAGMSRNTVYRLEKGEPGLSIGHILRYLEAIAPGVTLLDLLSESDPALVGLQARERTRRVRDISAAEAKDLDF